MIELTITFNYVKIVWNYWETLNISACAKRSINKKNFFLKSLLVSNLFYWTYFWRGNFLLFFSPQIVLPKYAFLEGARGDKGKTAFEKIWNGTYFFHVHRNFSEKWTNGCFYNKTYMKNKTYFQDVFWNILLFIILCQKNVTKLKGTARYARYGYGYGYECHYPHIFEIINGIRIKDS